MWVCYETRHGGMLATIVRYDMEVVGDVWIPNLDHGGYGSKRKGRRASQLHHAALLRVVTR